MSVQRRIKRELLVELRQAFNDNDHSVFNIMMSKLEGLDIKDKNVIEMSDAYKYSHQVFYPKGMSKLYSYLESRGGKFGKTMQYGLQYLLKEYLVGQVITQEKIDSAKINIEGAFGGPGVADMSKFQYLLDNYDGKLPVKIMSVPEGTLVDASNVLMTIVNTGDENTAWVTNWLESLLLQIWYPITVSTMSFFVKKMAREYFEKTSDLTGDALEMSLEFFLNDFGLRGVETPESAMLGGSAHLVNMRGSDNIPTAQFLKDNYNTETVWGLSIPATEHSVMTMYGPTPIGYNWVSQPFVGELKMMDEVLTAYPDRMVACVSDTYNIFRAVTEFWGDALKARVLARPVHAPLVIRPDSGDPKETLREIFKLLFETFGYTTNSKGYKVLPPQIRVIQGDGVNFESIKEILEMLVYEKISVENLVFGAGGALLQMHNRDTHKFAFKGSFRVIDSIGGGMIKTPTEMDKDGNITESFKKSKTGKLKLVKTQDGYRTVTSFDDDFYSVKNELIPVFRDGELLISYTFEEIRERANKQ